MLVSAFFAFYQYLLLNCSHVVVRPPQAARRIRTSSSAIAMSPLRQHFWLTDIIIRHSNVVSVPALLADGHVGAPRDLLAEVCQKF